MARLGDDMKPPPPARAGPFLASGGGAGEAGLPRAVAETPYEYLPRLERAWPEYAANLHSITDAYVDVHYGEREFPPPEVDRLREAWKQMERVLKKSNAGTVKN